MYTIYINNTLPPALAVHEIYRDIFGPPMVIPSILNFEKQQSIDKIILQFYRLTILNDLLPGKKLFSITASQFFHDPIRGDYQISWTKEVELNTAKRKLFWPGQAKVYIYCCTCVHEQLNTNLNYKQLLCNQVLFITRVYFLRLFLILISKS